MKAKEVINSVNERLQAAGYLRTHQDALTNPRLNDYRKYLRPAPVTYPGKDYYNYSSRHCDILFGALVFIVRDGMKTAAAFAAAIADIEDTQQTRLAI